MEGGGAALECCPVRIDITEVLRDATLQICHWLVQCTPPLVQNLQGKKKYYHVFSFLFRPPPILYYGTSNFS